MPHLPQHLPQHGVLLEINAIGVYLIGESGIGKSEIALQLIQNGASLICDDAPEFTINSPQTQVIGHCPEDFISLMHIHDLGVINVRTLFGEQFAKNSSPIHFIIHLLKANDRLEIINQQTPEQLLQPNDQQWQFQAINIPGINLHLYPGRNIIAIIKTALLQFSNYDRIDAS
ncbi:hypothetical protein [sulfur-oxidizing endosymbiont of Gigantopelta aegis]|uniref:hypothetical protein n=1 Tax=sulfur-oxidizing endosymbiont of Gigantopelta aegis TaxID=2794934 RepID=UPI0018DB65AB|nr:hypothetical protein [sulfur-oxidizing endosymbiont of Gigantopelta aegis]